MIFAVKILQTAETFKLEFLEIHNEPYPVNFRNQAGHPLTCKAVQAEPEQTIIYAGKAIILEIP